MTNLLSSNATDARFNNLRAAFLAGIAYGLEKESIIFQEGDEPVPLDYRDFVYRKVATRKKLIFTMCTTT